MNFGKVFKIFKKGAKAAKKRAGKKAGEPVRWPGGTRIGIFGHANAGKTVYFTVLNEDCKISKKLQISVTDTTTAGEFLSHYRSIWGLGTATGTGTVVDFRGERKFPDPTQADKVLRFNAILDRKKKLSVVAFDYSGDNVSISSASDTSEKVLDFMAGCDGILFFYDPKILGAELESQARVASFVNMLEYLAPLKSRLPIPIAVVVTKSDVLPGYSGEDQVTLIGPEDEYLASEEFEIFLERVLAGRKVDSNANWAGSVRSVLVRLKDFLQVVLRRTLDFQIFFVSCTGAPPEKIGTDIGRSLYAPPPKMQPIGVKEPFYWLLNSIVRNKRISTFRTVAKYVAMISIIWVVLFSLPSIYHFWFLYPKPPSVEQSVAKVRGSLAAATKDDRSRIAKAYRDYERARTVNWFFDEYKVWAGQIASYYLADRQREDLQDLDYSIGRVAMIVGNKAMWPQVKPTDSTIIPNPEYDRLVEVLRGYHVGDSTSPVFIKSGRALEYWDIFINGVKKANDQTVWENIQKQVKIDSELNWSNLSKEERALLRAFPAVKVEKERAQAAEQVAVELGDLIDAINDNESPEYRLGEAVDTLEKIQNLVSGEVAGKVKAYLNKAREWERSREYAYVIDNIPAESHLHIAVAGKGKEPSWKVGDQIVQYPGRQEKIAWKPGDIIYIALDSSKDEESWGEQSKSKRILRSDYSLFEMDGDIMFDGNTRVSIRFVPPLKDQLPKLK